MALELAVLALPPVDRTVLVDVNVGVDIGYRPRFVWAYGAVKMQRSLK